MQHFENLLDCVIQNYQLTSPITAIATISSVNNLNLHIGTANGDFIVKCYQNNQKLIDLAYEHQLLNWLQQQQCSFALPLPIATNQGLLVVNSDQGLITLTPKFAGETPEFRLLDGERHPLIQQWAYALGTSLGELHTALQRYPIRHRPTPSLFQALLNYAQPHAAVGHLAAQQLSFVPSQTADLWAWWREEAADLALFVANDYPNLPQQICHNDYAPPNILVDSTQVRAILDFEFACPAARALDVAMALRMIMQLDTKPRDPWLVAEHFCQGYAEWLKLTRLEIAAMPQLIRLRTAIPLVWALSKPDQASQANLALAIQRMQQSKTWLRQQQAQFSVMLHAAFD